MFYITLLLEHYIEQRKHSIGLNEDCCGKGLVPFVTDHAHEL